MKQTACLPAGRLKQVYRVVLRLFAPCALSGSGNPDLNAFCQNGLGGVNPRKNL